MALEILQTENAPAAVGPYSQGVKAGNIVFSSGQLHINPETGKLVEGDIKDITKQCLENVKAVLAAGGATLEDVVKVTVFVTDIGQFSEINSVYAEYFSDHKPARSLFEVAKLPAGGQVEIEAIAVI